MEEIIAAAEELKKMGARTSLNYLRNKHGTWIWSFRTTNIHTGYILCGQGNTPKKAFDRFVKRFYAKGGLEKYHDLRAL